jgi:hypothetical protein
MVFWILQSIQTNLRTNSTEQSPSWEANSHPPSQEIPSLLCNLKVHYSVHKSLPLDPVLSICAVLWCENKMMDDEIVM